MEALVKQLRASFLRKFYSACISVDQVQRPLSGSANRVLFARVNAQNSTHNRECQRSRAQVERDQSALLLLPIGDVEGVEHRLSLVLVGTGLKADRGLLSTPRGRCRP